MPYDDGKPVTKYKRPSELQIFLIKDDQAGMCAICGEFLSKETKHVMVDHCHETNRIRGLLCRRCNIGLGMFKDSIRNLKEAINYLINSKNPNTKIRSNVGKYHRYDGKYQNGWKVK